MKICILTPEFLPSWGGIGTYTYYLARGLQERAEVHVVTSANAPGDAAPQELEHVTTHEIGTPAVGADSARSALQFQVAVLRTLPRLIKDYGFDVVHANHAQMSDVLARLRSSRAQNVVTVHTTLGTQLHGTLKSGAGQMGQAVEKSIVRHRRVLRFVERRYLRNSPSLIFVSRWIRDQAFGYRLHPRVSRIVPNAVDSARFVPSERLASNREPETAKPFTLLFAGRLLAQKGLSTLLQALALLPHTVRLVVAGPGDPTPWREYARALKMMEDQLAKDPTTAYYKKYIERLRDVNRVQQDAQNLHH